ncbi:MAG: hypothetical protein QXR44_02720 [Thermoproteota archaeon]
MHSRGATLLLLFILSLLIIISPGITKSEAAPTICFLRAYYASFDNSFSIQPSGSFNPAGGVVEFIPGFKNNCVNLSASQGSSAILATSLDIKSSFKTSFMMKISANVVFNFTRLRLKPAGSTDYFEVVLGRRDGNIAVFKGNSVSRGGALNYGKWYNITINLDVSGDYLTVLGNGSQLIQVSTGIALHYLTGIELQIGIMNPSSSVKVYLDEFSTLVSPIVFTDKPVYTSSSNVPVRITGDQFPSRTMEIAILRPDGSTIEKRIIPSANVNNSFISGFYGFSYPIGLSNPSPGTYTIRVNGSGFRVEYHFGVWNIPKIWERKSIIRIRAGGFAPNSFVTLSVRNSTREILSQRLSVNQYGNVDQNMTVPVNLQIGTLRVLLVYDGTYDFSKMSGSTGFIDVTVIKAILNVTVVTDTNTYERVSPISIMAYVKYKDGSTLPWNGIVRLSLIYNGIGKQTVYMEYAYDGYWSKTIRLGPSDERGDYLIKVEASDPYGNSGTGNKTITITIARLIVTLVNQLEENYQRSTKLNLSVNVRYKDGIPVDSGKVTLEMIMGSRKIGPFPFVKTSSGQWMISQKIPISEQAGRWDLKITAVDDSDNMGDLSLSISIVPAKLVIRLLEPLNHDFSRTQSVPVSVAVRYPSYEALGEENSLVNASLIYPGKGVVSSKLLRFSVGGWRGDVYIPKDAPLGEYVLRVSAKDLHGNYGCLNNTIRVSKAILNVTIEDLKEVYQIGFDVLRLKCVIRYLDNSIMSEGNVTAMLSSSTISTTVVLKYDNGKWVGEYNIPMTTPTGDYVISVIVADPYGNTGLVEDTFKVSNLYIVLIVVSIAIALSISVSILILRRRRPRAPPFPMEEEYDVYG